MESINEYDYPWTWTWATYAYQFLAPTVHVRGRTALLVLAVVLWAFLWLLWRAYTVISTDNDILVGKLGLDIPPEPTLTLEEIAARHIQISWKPDELTPSILEYQVELSGRTIGVTKKYETAAVIANLQPGTLYEVRIFSISPGRFQTPSRTLHFRTSLSGRQDSNNDEHPVVRPLAPRLATAAAPPPAPVPARELNPSTSAARRGTGARKTSPAGQPDLINESKEIDDDQGEDLAELSQQFSDINNEIDTIEAQIQDEIREFDPTKREKEHQRQTYLQEVKERDEASNDLKRQVHRAESTSRSLLNEKMKREKLLKDKQNRRQKRSNEMVQWEESAKTIEEEIDAIHKQKDAHCKRLESQVREVKEKIAEEQREIQLLEEENKEKAEQLKELQEERKRNSVDEETEESRETDRRDYERDTLFRETLTNLSQQYNQLWLDLQKMQQEHVLARQRLSGWEVRRQTVAFAPLAAPDLETIRRSDRFGPRIRTTGSRGSNVSSPRAAYAPEPFASVNEAVTTSSPLASRPTIFNSVNGMTIPVDAPHNFDEDDEYSLPDAPMSPRADALLPTDLLGDDSGDEMLPDEDEGPPPKPTSKHSQTVPFPTFVPGAMPQPDRESDSPSPGSPSSPRSYASPREDFFTTGDPDGRSIRSSHPPIPEDAPVEPPTHKRLTSMSNLFSFNRQRGKTSSADQPPMLGSLKHESHSFPRKMEDFDATLQPRRRLSYGGNNWMFPGTNFLTKDSEPDLEPKPRRFPNLLPGIGKPASRNYDPFAPRTGSLDPGGRGGSSSPRPGSTYSFDILPRPSVEQISWEFRPGARNSPLVPDWSSSISRSHSRRPSLGFGSQTNLSLRPGEDDGDFLEPKRAIRPSQPPIGTRPTSSSQQRPATPKLNPAAPTFTSGFLSFGKNKDKTKDKDKTKLADGSTPQPNSPPESRKSKDTAHSIALTTASESRDSLERTTSSYSAGGPSFSASLESTPASSSRPTFISKITRKASSNKFDSWKTKSTSIFSSSRNIRTSIEATTPTGDITEDETHPHSYSHSPNPNTGSTEHLGRSMESNFSTPGATPIPSEKEKDRGSRTSLGSWNFMRKKQKNNKEPGGGSAMPADLVSESGEGTDYSVDGEGSVYAFGKRGSHSGVGTGDDASGGSRPTT